LRMLILSVGKLSTPFYREGFEEYRRRLSRYLRVEQVSVPEERPRGRPEGAEIVRILREEGLRLARHIRPGHYLVALDSGGEMYSSEAFAKWLEGRLMAGAEIAFVIGGAWGLDRDLLARADLRLSLSRLTFPHEMVPLILLEQIYRAFKILRGEPYHR